MPWQLVDTILGTLGQVHSSSPLLLAGDLTAAKLILKQHLGPHSIPVHLEMMEQL